MRPNDADGSHIAGIVVCPGALRWKTHINTHNRVRGSMIIGGKRIRRQVAPNTAQRGVLGASVCGCDDTAHKSPRNRRTQSIENNSEQHSMQEAGDSIILMYRALRYGNARTARQRMSERKCAPSYTACEGLFLCYSNGKPCGGIMCSCRNAIQMWNMRECFVHNALSFVRRTRTAKCFGSCICDLLSLHAACEFVERNKYV